MTLILRLVKPSNAPPPERTRTNLALPDYLKRRFRNYAPADLARLVRAARSRHGVAIAEFGLALEYAIDWLDTLLRLGPHDLSEQLIDTSWGTRSEVWKRYLIGLSCSLENAGVVFDSIFSGVAVTLARELEEGAA